MKNQPIYTEQFVKPFGLMGYWWLAYREMVGIKGKGASERAAINDLLEEE